MRQCRNSSTEGSNSCTMQELYSFYFAARAFGASGCFIGQKLAAL